MFDDPTYDSHESESVLGHVVRDGRRSSLRGGIDVDSWSEWRAKTKPPRNFPKANLILFHMAISEDLGTRSVSFIDIDP